MSLFGSVSSKQVDEFAVALAREFAEQFPPAAGGGGRPATPARKLVNVLEALFRRALEFKTRNKLGVYKKARLGNSFRWELSELGYDKTFAEDVTQRLIVQLSRRS